MTGDGDRDSSAGCAISELLDIIRNPLPGALPFGENVNHDADFDSLKAEIGKIGALDYDLIEARATTILKSKSKDIRALAFVSLAYLRNEKWESFADVFDGFAQLAEKDFDALFPDRPRAKELAVKWLAEGRYTELLKQKKPAENDYDHVCRLADALTKLKTLLDQKFPGASPFPAALLKNAQEWQVACKPKPQPQAASPAGAAGGAAGQAEPMETPRQAQAIAKTAAVFLIEKDTPRIMGYRLMRSLRWDLIEKAPPSESGKTQLPAPNEQQRTYLQNLLAQKEWKTLFDKAEEAFASGANHFWLALQHYSVAACKELGESHREVGKAILFETAFFVNRIPEVVNLSFVEGVPFCGDATKDWINTEVRAALAGQSGAPAPASAGDAIEEERRQVNALMAAGQIEKALEVLQNGIRTCAKEEDNFKRSILIGQLLLKAKQVDIAVSVLESLDEKITTYHLERWNADLAIEAWAALVQAYKIARPQKAPNVQAAMTDKFTEIIRKISQTNPQKAFELTK